MSNNKSSTRNYATGQLVSVEPRTWAGINRPGGIGIVTHTQCCSYGYVETVDVKYVVGGLVDTKIDLDFVKPHVELLGRRSRRGRDFLVLNPKDGKKQARTATAADPPPTASQGARVTPAADHNANRQWFDQDEQMPQQQDQATSAVATATAVTAATTRGSTTNHNWSCGAVTSSTFTTTTKKSKRPVVAPVDCIHLYPMTGNASVSPLGVEIKKQQAVTTLVKTTVTTHLEPSSVDMKIVARPRQNKKPQVVARPQRQPQVVVAQAQRNTTRPVEALVLKDHNTNIEPSPRIQLLNTFLSDLFGRSGDTPLCEKQLVQLVNHQLLLKQQHSVQNKFESREVQMCLEQLSDKGRIMVSEGLVYNI